ncbi:MAG: hypothetical protein LBR66_05520 [Candidatus Symbiothrix sp.]|jgi:hypothetical protein|nr:hypothetical protein [Candidatus Symbiothrix sp.]
MKFLHYAGLILMAIGILWLIVPYFTRLQTNISLLTGWVILFVGCVAYVVAKKHRK